MALYQNVRINDINKQRSWVYLLESKYDVLGCFKKFKAFVENDNGHYLKTLTSNRGGEFMSKDFTRFCEEHVIRRQLIASCSAHLNRVA